MHPRRRRDDVVAPGGEGGEEGAACCQEGGVAGREVAQLRGQHHAVAVTRRVGWGRFGGMRSVSRYFAHITQQYCTRFCGFQGIVINPFEYCVLDKHRGNGST